MFHSFESILIQIALARSNHLNFATNYKPLPTSNQLFLKEFGELLDLLQSLPVATVISGDFNIYVETECYPLNQFHQLLSYKM